MNFPSARVRERNVFRRQAWRGTGLLALAGIVYAAAGIAYRLAAETRRYRRSADILYRRWTSIPAVAGTGKLRIHARLRDVMTHRDPIVLVHGCGSGGSYFVPLAARISDHAPVFVPDLPGHGRSDRDARALDVPQLAQALAHWMDAMGLRRAVVVGHGAGCQVALRLAAMHPEFASRVALIGPTADVPQDVLRSVACPISVVGGERDHGGSRRRVGDLARAAGAPQPIGLPGWSHALPYEDPDTVAAVILGLGTRPERERRAAPRFPPASPP